MTTTEAVMDFLFEHRVSALPPTALAEVFDRLVWCMDDNGEEIAQVRESWLRGEDPERIAIALAMPSLFPFRTREEMARAFERISVRWPHLASDCARILERWDEQAKRTPS